MLLILVLYLFIYLFILCVHWFQVLDSKDLNIKKVTDHGSGKALEFSVGEKTPTLGSKFEIKLPCTKEMR
jgi:hypothetical protein